MIKKNKKAMTLIEMLIVLIIIGFLVGQLVKVFGFGMEASEKHRLFNKAFIEFKSRMSNEMFGKQNIYSMDSSKAGYNPTDGMMVNMTVEDMNNLIKGSASGVPAFSGYSPMRDTNGRFYEVKTLQYNNLMLDECYDKTFSQEKGNPAKPMISCSNMGIVRFIGVGDNGQEDGDNNGDNIIDDNNVLSQGDDLYKDINLKLEYFDNIQKIRNLHNTIINMIYGIVTSTRHNFIVDDNFVNYGSPLSEERVTYSHIYNMLSHYTNYKYYQNKNDNGVGFFTGSVNIENEPEISDLANSVNGLVSKNPFQLGTGSGKIIITSIPSVIRSNITGYISPNNPCVKTKTCTWKKVITDNYFAIPFSTNVDKTKIFYKVYNIKI